MRAYKTRPRLRSFTYKGYYRYFITICTHDRAPLFQEAEHIPWLIGLLQKNALEFDFKVWAYCFMPDHVHLLVEGTSPTSDLRKFVSAYKQKSGHGYKRQMNRPLWQASYYEHVLREDEDTLGAARYIFENPVRKGLVPDFSSYRYHGSFEFDIKEFC
jgi:putative transposase